MRIARVALDDGSYRPSEIGPLPVGLSVVHGPPGAGKSTLASLVAETLFGLRVPHEAEAFAARPAGYVEVNSAEGSFRLRRRATDHAAPHERGRLTIAGLEGQAPTPETLGKLLGGVSPETVARVCYLGSSTGDVSRRDELVDLLSDEVAREFCRLENLGPRRPVASVDSSHLLSRRDEVAHEIERRLAERRRTSGELESQLQRLTAESTDLANRRESLEQALRGVENELAVVESRLRYQAIAEETDRAAQQREATDWQPKIEELDRQIQQWRATLAELEHREAEVRSELTIIHPDDAEPSLPLADQRAGVAVARRLVEDLESEVARLARSSSSDICVCRDAHPRLNPLVDTLGRQLARLAELAEQQEQALHVQSLQAEAAHLARSQDDLRKQLDHLLGRRQTLWRTTRARPDQRSQDSNASLAGDYEQAVESEGATSEHRLALDARRRELAGELAELDQRRGEIDAERKALSYKRSNLLSDATLDALQAELDDLQARLQVGATTAARESFDAPTGRLSVGRLRASEWFAKLTDGRFSGLRLVEGGRRLVVIGPGGEERSARSLSDGERRLAAMSLRLALVGGLGQYGVALPLVLDEPFAGLTDRQSAILANVLDDFSRVRDQAGEWQVVVFTSNRSAIERFKALGAPLLPVVHTAARVETPPPIVTRRLEVAAAPLAPTSLAEPVSAQSPSVAMSTRTVVQASDYLLAPADPIERFPVPIADRTGVFARSRIRTIDDLLSADPSAVAEELDRDDITAELVALWQTHLATVCFVPEMTLEDASLLTAIGLYSVEELAEVESAELESQIVELLASERGDRYRRRGYTASRKLASTWVSRAQRGLERWRSSDTWSRAQRHRGERRQRISAGRPARRRSAPPQSLRVRSVDRDRTARERSNKNGSQRSGATQPGKPRREWRFYLDTTSPVVDAPSIGPKTAKRVQKAGVRTVAELLAADAEGLAQKIDNPRITAETVVAWQHQAGLVCRIPQIRGHDAQILVACGFTQPEEIASMKPAELLEFVEPFCATSEGQKILRNGKEPDLAEVTDWIHWSRHSRLLGAA